MGRLPRSRLGLALLDRLHRPIGRPAREIQQVARLLDEVGELIVVEAVEIHAGRHAVDGLTLSGDPLADPRLGALHARLGAFGNDVVLELRLAGLDPDGVLAHHAQLPAHETGQIEIADDSQAPHR